MKSFFKKTLCVLLGICMLMSSGMVAFAAEADSSVPVIVVNDIEANPIINTTDNSIVFNYNDYKYDVLFTDGFSSNILELFSKDTIDQIQSGDLSTTDIIMMLADYLGFSADATTVVNKVIEIVTGIMGNMDSEDIDIGAIIGSIDFKGMGQDIKDKINNSISSFNYIALKEDGTPVNADTGCGYYPESLEYYYDDDSEAAFALAGELGESTAEKVGYENTYVFSYDWRLDPIANASLLNDFVSHVKSETGASKVSMISEGYGATVATAYLSQFESKAASDIKNFVTVSSEFLGTSLVGDYFKGNIVNEHTNITNYTSAYIRYTNDISDNPITSFSTWLLNYILNNEWDLQGFCMHVTQFLSELNMTFKADGITSTLTNMPGIWALVPVSDYDDAAENLFTKDTSAALTSEVEAFKDLQSDYENILQNAKKDGINISVVASWDLQLIPIGENNSVQSDGIVDTAYASFGATCIALNSVTAAMNATQANEATKHDHISDDYDMLTPWYSYGGICHYIDASTCALPENTWFIRNMKHGSFNHESNSMDFLMTLITADSEKTVWQDVAYMQFMQYNRFINPGVLASNGVASNPATPGRYLMGDINLDGKVTSIDSRLALRCASGLDKIEKGSLPFINGDVYADDVINAADARKILLMSAGLIDDMQSGIELNYVAEQGLLAKSTYSIELSAKYNSITNTLDVTATIPNAVNAYCGNYVMTYDSKMLTYKDVTTYNISGGYIVAGAPIDRAGTVTCAFSTDKAITAADCDKDGNLILCTYSFDVSRKNVTATSLSIGATHFYENGGDTFVAPYTLNLDEDTFFMLGDADNDRYITANDARIILRIAAKIDKVADDAMFARCDVDGDGKITAKDARLVLRASARLISSFTQDDAETITEEVSVKA